MARRSPRYPTSQANWRYVSDFPKGFTGLPATPERDSSQSGGRTCKLAKKKSLAANQALKLKVTKPQVELRLIYHRTEADVKPEIELPRLGRDISQFSIELSHTLPKGSLYLYDADVVQINPHLEQMGSVKFRTWITYHVLPAIYKKAKVNEQEVLMFYNSTISESTSKAVLASDQLKKNLLEIERVIDFPMPMVCNGEVFIPKVGYNQETKTYLRSGFPEIDYNMSLDVAKDIIDTMLRVFCFKTDDTGQSKCHAIARILTPYFRGIINGLVPFWNYKANRPRAGKDYLAQVAHLIYTGKACEDASLPEHDPKGHDKSEGTIKRITGYFREGRTFVDFANCSGYIDDKYFIQVITAPEWSDRILGKSETKSWINTMDISISGNFDLALKPDIEPRSRHIMLEYFDEDENSRTLSIPDLHRWILENRGLILSAIHAFYRHWVEQGKPAGRTPFTSFQKWASVIGGVMTCPGIEFGDPCLRQPRPKIGIEKRSVNAKKCQKKLVINTKCLLVIIALEDWFQSTSRARSGTD
jgi:hypothetical protein